MFTTAFVKVGKNLSIFLISCTIILSCQRAVNSSNEPKKKEGQNERRERDLKMMKDPALGYIPTDRLIKAKEYRDGLWHSQNNAVISGISWNELGPKNLGGRTRAMLIDANDATGNTIWAGGVGGGLWKTTDITTSEPNWVAVDDFFANLAITSIAQDPSNAQIMYFCTGEEGYFNADAIRGAGVWKTTNGGTTWTQLAATTGFTSCQKIIVNSTGIVFVATGASGLQRSFNGGNTWTKVLGTALGITGAANNLCYDVDIAANGDVYSTLYGTVHKSTNAGLTFAAAQTLGITASRIELACAPSDANYVYALVENGNVVAGILQTTTGGTSWTPRSEPDDADPGIPNADFSRSQAWYDLTIAVDPNNRDVLMVGAIDIFKSTDGAGTWTQLAHWYGGFGFTYVHADQHNIVYRPGSSSIAYFTNDGGVFRTANANAGTPTIEDKGINYITSQFYACALHPTALTSYALGGTQDNGSHQFTEPVLQNTIEVTGGDGAFCHIDQNQSQYQFTSYVYNDFYRSANSGSTWTNVVTGGGDFISPTDYDDANNLMYMCNTAGTYKRWDDPQTGSTFASVAVANFGGGNVSAVKVSPNTAHRVFFGIDNGRVVRVDNANTGAPTTTNISTGLPGAYVSCIEVETGNDNHLLVTYSNYGDNSVWESTNGGSSWTSVEGNLPDMPIRWALFNPSNNDQVVVATELGVWSTDNLIGGATVWGSSNSGLANVRVDMLQLRTSDNLMIAATHGRGLFSTDIFTTPTALFTADKITTYQGVPVNFSSTSYKGTSWSWAFGDAGTSALENPSHSYTTAGKYSVTLTINSGASALTKTSYIHVLPNRGTPYTPANGGNFESNTNDFGSMSLSGSTDKWERGVPANFLTTVNSAANAWKTDLDADLTEGTYSCAFMTPNYNFSSASTGYLMRFRKSMEIHFCNAPFAVQVQYTLNKGTTWTRLGVNADPAASNWYNNGPATGCPVDAGIFADRYGWINNTNNLLCTYNLDFLAGNTNVAFRFVLSVASGYSAIGYARDGFMIDDFEIVGPFNATLAVSLINFSAVKKNNDAIINWRTANEVDINNYVLERSYDGTAFALVTSLPAKNNTSNTYNYTDVNAVINAGSSKYIYYRLKITDKTGRIKYSEIAKVSLNKMGPQITIGPNVFSGFVSVYSNEAIKNVLVYDMSGKLVYQTANITGNKIFFSNDLPKGMYVFKILTSGGTVTKKLVKG